MYYSTLCISLKQTKLQQYQPLYNQRNKIHTSHGAKLTSVSLYGRIEGDPMININFSQLRRAPYLPIYVDIKLNQLNITM